jgi:D-2-hydroxyacid dehydrogenase (NADP+)
MNRSIIVDPDIGAVSADDISKRIPENNVHQPDDVAHALREFSEPTALIVSNRTWQDEYIDALSADDWVTTIGVGYDDFPIDALSHADVSFTNCPGISAEQISEHVFGGIFAFTRNLWTYRKQQDTHTWDKHRWKMTDLAGDKCCLLGLGGIGEAIAKRAKAFGIEVHGVKQETGAYNGSADTVYSPKELDDALSGARLLIIAVPLTEKTQGMISRYELEILADDAIVVNVARGPVLITEALLFALRNGLIDAAFLDVTDPEPLPESHPLWEREDVFITPHCGGSSEKYPDRFVEFFDQQYSRWCDGQKLRHRVV